MNRTQALNILARTLQEGGGTFQNGLDVSDQLESGFVVGGIIPSSVQPADAHNTIVNELIELSDKYSLIGTWLHEDEIHIDAVEIVDNLEDALALGKARGELAIWDVANATEVVVQ